MADYWSYYTNEKFKDLVKSEMQAAAIAIMNEAASTAGHTERTTYAKSVLSGEASVYEFCVGVITISTVKAAITAGNEYQDLLAGAVSSLWNSFAGVINV